MSAPTQVDHDRRLTRAETLIRQLQGIARGIPTGGSVGDILAKQSDADYDTAWVDSGGAFAFFNG